MARVRVSDSYDFPSDYLTMFHLKNVQRYLVFFHPQPLNPNPQSNWGMFFKDNEMLLQIDKDCR